MKNLIMIASLILSISFSLFSQELPYPKDYEKYYKANTVSKTGEVLDKFFILYSSGTFKNLQFSIKKGESKYVCVITNKEYINRDWEEIYLFLIKGEKVEVKAIKNQKGHLLVYQMVIDGVTYPKPSMK